ncbi:histidinol-phosphatase (PHP family) [Keratinibaculum paraultunense]|uniref:Histidinol-phosphatase n=1 Tax=Keratinibaculum paraultunense TaxID=1278232 RepID=A0A4R3KRD3_9FIRM|nr:histidinol-phosphatase HisJ family protein [Keratinibaculum paraultunense]QQY78793.1 histidinol-phosphatase HisJ family protein [Keratinibaculum paraultunense]TCS87498.1 histidinol-phosphatase (PHP family) [Keratinibaculum paraultunense]
MYDFHVHSDFSMDCKYLMEEMVLGAIENNVKSICFTDHVDYDVTEDKIDIDFRTEDYFKKVKQVKYKYKNQIEILTGVEIGMQPHLSKRYDKLINSNPFDFVLMSIHSIEGKDIHLDNFTHGKKPIDALVEYYEYLYRCVESFDNFDVLGHIDYIDRYFEDYSTLPDFNEYKPIVEKILNLIIEKDKGLEINTASKKYGLNYYHPKLEILQLYKYLGGKVLTIGSDAHSPEYIGYDYKSAEKLLRDLEFKYIYIFKERKKYPIHIA